MHTIILDSNFIIPDFFLEGTRSQMLFDIARTSDSKVLIPRLVVEEVVRKYGRKYKELIDRVNEVQSLLEKMSHQSVEKTKSANKYETKYRSSLIALLKERNVEIIPNVKINESVIYLRALKPKRPFEEGDKGFRDTIIWLTVLDYAKRNPVKCASGIFFMTQDSVYYSNKSSTEMHQDFKDDILANAETVPFRFLSNIESLRDLTIKKGPKKDERLTESIKSIDYSFDIIEIHKSLIGEEIESRLFAKFIAFEAVIKEVYTSGHYIINSILPIYNDKIYLNLTTNLNSEIEIRTPDENVFPDVTEDDLGNYKGIIFKKLSIEIIMIVSENDGKMMSYEITTIDINEE